jgi:hypothetical protein
MPTLQAIFVDLQRMVARAQACFLIDSKGFVYRYRHQDRLRELLQQSWFLLTRLES